MYAVIFRAKMADLDDLYLRSANRLRELAFSRYGCMEFVSVTEGEDEISISYWESEDQILAWKDDPEHLEAQTLGQSQWYRAYQVQVAEIKHEYRYPSGS